MVLFSLIIVFVCGFIAGASSAVIYKNKKRSKWRKTVLPQLVTKNSRELLKLEAMRNKQDYGRKYEVRPDAGPPVRIHRNVFKAGHRRFKYGPPDHP